MCMTLFQFHRLTYFYIAWKELLHNPFQQYTKLYQEKVNSNIPATITSEQNHNYYMQKWTEGVAKMSPRLLPTTSIHHDKQDPNLCGSNTEQRSTHSTSHTTSQLQQNSYLSLLYSLPITTTWTLYLLPH